jgi:hypothetical protein
MDTVDYESFQAWLAESGKALAMLVDAGKLSKDADTLCRTIRRAMIELTELGESALNGN